VQGRPDFLGAALEDRIHQPYRAPLCPLLPTLQELKGKYGILGVVLSGAGPSVLAFLHPHTSVSRARKAISAKIAQKGLAAELLPTAITLRGGKS